MTIKLTVVITLNMKRRPNVVVLWACIADNDTALNQQRVKSMCLVGTLNVLPFEKKQRSNYSKVQKPSAQAF